MAAVPLTRFLQHLHGLAVRELGDQQLVQQFAATADETAFAALVRRHGGLVLGVCRRVLGAGPDAEDAVQATFVLLARKARSIRKQASVASWLYGVAYRLSLQLRTRRARRRQHETVACASAEVPTMAREPAACASLRELAAILDEELQRLPAPCREALVLCHLEGLSHTEAAQQLGWPLGTLKGRVKRAHALLRQRLERRGVALSAIALASVLSSQASAAVSPGLLNASIRCASPATIPARVADIADSAVFTAGKLKAVGFAAVTTLLLTMAVGASQVDWAAVPPALDQLPPAPVALDLHGDPLPSGATSRLGTPRWRHGGAITFAALLPDGERVVTAGEDRHVRVSDRETGRELRRFGPGPRAPSPVSDVTITIRGRPASTVAAISADSKTLAAHFDGPAIQLWDIATGKELRSIPLADAAPAVKRLVVASLAFAPDGLQLAIGSTDGTIHLWDLAQHKASGMLGQHAPSRRRFVSGDQASAVYAPNGKILASIHSTESETQLEQHIQFWDVASGKLRHAARMSGQSGLQSGVFSPDSKRFAFALQREAVILDVASGNETQRWKLNLLFIAPLTWPALAFSADSERLYATVGDGTVYELDSRTGKELRRLADRGGRHMFALPTNGPSCLAMAPDGKTLALGGIGHALRFVDVASGKGQQLTGPAHAMLQVMHSADSKTLLTRDADHGLWRWDRDSGKLLGRRAVPADTFRLVVSPDGRYIAAEVGGGNIAVHDAAGKQVFTVAGTGSFPTCFFSADGTTLLVRYVTETFARLHDVPGGKERRRLPVADKAQSGAIFVDPENVQLFLSPDGKRLAISSLTQPLTIVDTTNERIVYRAAFGDGLLMRNVVFAPDRRTVALDAADGVVRLIELATGQERCRYGEPLATRAADPPGAVMIRGYASTPASSPTLAFSPNGRLLAHARPDSNLQVWDVATGRNLARLTGHTAPIQAVAFAPDGHTVATGSSDTTALIWDVGDISGKAGPVPRKLTAADLPHRWDALQTDAGTNAVNAMIASPREAVAFLQDRLRPALPVDAAQVATLIDNLGSDEFEVRQQAQSKLEALGEQLAPYLPKVMSSTKSLETRRRLEALEQLWTSPRLSGERLRTVRAIEVLERIANPEAREVLARLAEGAPTALITIEAQAALRRLPQ
jgi:RNA polymerase sigma factor (sigma-70 family)